MSKELLFGFLTKAYNKTEDELAPLLFDGDEIKESALQTLIDLDANKVKRFKDEQTKMFDNGYKKAQKEVLTDYEKKIKESLGIDTDVQGEEFISLIKQKYEQNATAKPSKLTDEDVKKHPVFLDYEKKWKQEKETAVLTERQQFEQFKAQIERGNKINLVKSKANEYFNILKPILPKDITKAERQKNLFFKELEELDYEVNENNIVILKDGKRLENTNGYPVSFDDFIKDKITNTFELQAQEPKGSVGNNNNNARQPQQSGGVNMYPKSEREFGQSLMALGNDNEKIKELKMNYDNFNSQK